MAEIEITLPTVQYGNVKITATPEEWGLDTIADAPDVGVWAATYLNLFAQGFKVGAAMDVDAHLGAPKKPLDVGVPGAAEQRAESNLKPRTVDEANDMAAAVIKQELGATEVGDTVTVGGMEFTKVGESPFPEHNAAPWNKPAVDPKPKPWETGTSTPDKLVAGLGDEW